MATQLSDPIIIALIGVSGTALTAIVMWITSRHKRDADLLEKATEQIKLILGEREKQVVDLKDEVVRLRERVGALVETMRVIFLAGEHCPHRQDAECPIARVEIADAVSDMFVRPN